LPLRLVRVHRRVAVAHEVEAAWRAAQAGALDGEPPARGGTLLVWRRSVAVYHRRLDALETAALARAADGVPFGALCEQIADAVGPERAAQVAFELLSRWVADELLVYDSDRTICLRSVS